jgi:hypothetical protein
MKLEWERAFSAAKRAGDTMCCSSVLEEDGSRTGDEEPRGEAYGPRFDELDFALPPGFVRARVRPAGWWRWLRLALARLRRSRRWISRW